MPGWALQSKQTLQEVAWPPRVPTPILGTLSGFPGRRRTPTGPKYARKTQPPGLWAASQRHWLPGGLGLRWPP